jgi:hypothetical protein
LLEYRPGIPVLLEYRPGIPVPLANMYANLVGKYTSTMNDMCLPVLKGFYKLN